VDRRDDGVGGVKDVDQAADRLLHEVCLSRFSLIMCKRGFQAVLRIRPSSLFMLLGCIEDGTDKWLRNFGTLYIDAGEIPKRTYTIFKSQRKLEIYKRDISCPLPQIKRNFSVVIQPLV
jgi:hypothetical protein